MRTLVIGLFAAATLLTAAPALAQVEFGPGGVRIGPRYHDGDARFYRERHYGYREDCRRVTIERPDGSVVRKYRCD
jgi:hypothetical protein